MAHGSNEAFSRILIDKALEESGWNLLDGQRAKEIRELEAGQATSRTRLDALFQSMLHRAFNGEL